MNEVILTGRLAGRLFNRMKTVVQLHKAHKNSRMKYGSGFCYDVCCYELELINNSISCKNCDYGKNNFCTSIMKVVR